MAFGYAAPTRDARGNVIPGKDMLGTITPGFTFTTPNPSKSGGWGGTGPVRVSPSAGGVAPAVPTGPGYGDISGLFREALAGLTGETEKMYQSGKRRTLSDIAMQSVNAGMANTLNMPAAGIAYDEANRAQTNLGLASKRADILTGLGGVAAGMYGQNLGAQTQRYGIDVGAGSDAAQRALQQYIAELQNSMNLQELATRQGSYVR
jgi:hypothetical protein